MAEVRVSGLDDVHLAVISRLKRDQLTVSRRAARAQSTVDPRVSVTFDQRSFPTKKPIVFTAQVCIIVTQVTITQLPDQVCGTRCQYSYGIVIILDSLSGC